MDYIEVTVTKKTVISKEQFPALETLKNKRELFADKNEKLLAKLEKLAEKSKDCEIEFEFNDDVWYVTITGLNRPFKEYRWFLSALVHSVIKTMRNLQKGSVGSGFLIGL